MHLEKHQKEALTRTPVQETYSKNGGIAKENCYRKTLMVFIFEMLKEREYFTFRNFATGEFSTNVFYLQSSVEEQCSGLVQPLQVNIIIG